MDNKKNIDTLVKDIYERISSDEPFERRHVIEFGENLAKKLASRLSEERQKPALRLSNLGVPDRKLWYSINQPEKAELLPPNARLKFLFGDILEELLLFLARQAGHSVEGEQDEVSVEGVKGHRDAVIDGVLVDVKSASTYSFNKFSDHLQPSGDSFGYLTQLGSYSEGSKDDPLVTVSDESAFLVVDKTLGNLCLDKHKPLKVNYKKLVEEKRKMLAAPNPPGRCYPTEPDGKSGNMKLGVVCSYCPFKHECWPGIRTFIYYNGPRYLTKVTRVPDVPEVF